MLVLNSLVPFQADYSRFTDYSQITGIFADVPRVIIVLTVLCSMPLNSEASGASGAGALPVPVAVRPVGMCLHELQEAE